MYIIPTSSAHMSFSPVRYDNALPSSVLPTPLGFAIVPSLATSTNADNSEPRFTVSMNVSDNEVPDDILDVISSNNGQQVGSPIDPSSVAKYTYTKLDHFKATLKKVSYQVPSIDSNMETKLNAAYEKLLNHPTYHQIKSAANKVNDLNISYVMYKLCQLHGLDVSADQFITMKCKPNLDKHDEMWAQMSEEKFYENYSDC